MTASGLLRVSVPPVERVDKVRFPNITKDEERQLGAAGGAGQLQATEHRRIRAMEVDEGQVPGRGH